MKRGTCWFLLAGLALAVPAGAAQFRIPPHSFTVPDGFEVELVAGPPLVELGPAAACALTRYDSMAFGTEFENDLFSTEFNLRKVMRHELAPLGSTYRAKNSDFLVSDNTDFHPADVFEDADGSLLVVDTGGTGRAPG
jgi:glucose/arabinose dehydrogenase